MRGLSGPEYEALRYAAEQWQFGPCQGGCVDEGAVDPALDYLLVELTVRGLVASVTCPFDKKTTHTDMTPLGLLALRIHAVTSEPVAA